MVVFFVYFGILVYDDVIGSICDFFFGEIIGRGGLYVREGEVVECFVVWKEVDSGFGKILL